MNILKFSSIKIDKFAWTVKVSDAYQDTLDRKLKQFANSQPKLKVYRKGRIYRSTMFLGDEDTLGNLRIQWDPCKPTYNFIRFEFNPGKIDNLADFAKILSDLVGKDLWRSMGINMRITRIHFALDYVVVGKVRLFVDAKRYGTNKIFDTIGTKSFFGVLGTIYLGHSLSELSLTIYNKDAELRSKSRLSEAKRDHWNYDKCAPNETLVRFEAQCNPRSGLQPFLERLSENVFRHITVYAIPLHEEEDILFTFFLSDCMVKGMAATFQYLERHNPTEALRLRHKIRRYECKLDLINIRKGVFRAVRKLVNDLNWKI